MDNIIHFTSKLTTIKSILDSSSFRLTYCAEIFQLGIQKISSAAHPMVCFSEYNLNDLKDRTITYGGYGIGFSKEWARKKKLHPVIYVDKNSIVAKSLATLLRARQNKEENLASNLRLPIMTIKCFTKNIVGYNSYFNKYNFNFRDEHEWRFVPKKEEIGNALISQSRSKFLKKKDYYNNKVLPFPLKFDIKDIEYIFVQNEDERNIISSKYSIDKNTIQIAAWKT